MEIDLGNLVFEDTQSTNLDAIVLAPSGGGKSHIIGTLDGKVLYLYGDDEKHGKSSASGQKAEILPLSWSRNPNTGEKLNADETIAYILGLINDAFLDQHGITAIALDSLTSLEKVVRASSAWSSACLTRDGKHNSFNEGPAAQAIIDRIFNKIRDLQDGRKLDLVVTCIVDIESMDEDTGAYLSARPRLSTYRLAEGCVQQFPQVLLTGAVQLKGKKGHCLQFDGNITRVAKDLAGNVKRFMNFNPRVIGANRDLKQYEKADLETVRELLK